MVAAKRSRATPARPVVTIRLRSGQSIKSTELWNISLGGVFIEMKEPLGFGDEANFEFALGPGLGKVNCGGFVIWSTRESPAKGNGKPGVGVRLVDLGIAEMRTIADCVARAVEG